MHPLRPLLFILAVLIAVLFPLPQPAAAWGLTGHRVTGEIASHHLSEKAKARIQALLGHETLAQVSNWPDFVRSDPAWDAYQSWHYVNLKPGESYADAKHAPSGDLMRALLHFENILRDSKANREQRIVALKFYTHLVGDLHQPLHVGRAEDQGGNLEKVRWFGRGTDLHSVWDTHLIDHQQLSFTEYTAFIRHASKQQISSWQDSTYLDWMTESRNLVPGLYGKTKGRQWEYRYIHAHRETLEKRLLQGGIRLAGMLNRIFGNQPLTAKEKKMREIIPSAPDVSVTAKPKPEPKGK